MSRSAIRTSAAIFALVVGFGTAHAQRPTQGEDDSAALVEEGRASLRSGDLDDAAAALDQAIALNPRRIEAYVLRSAVYAARKQYAQGIALMRRAQGLAPDDEDVLTALGSQLVLSGDVAAGVPMLARVVAKNARRYDAQLLLGRHYHGTGAWPAAITAYEAYFAARPNELAREDAQHRVELADSYLRLNQPAKALALFERALGERREDLRARIGVAWATAAIDCRKARPLLRDLEPIATKYPEVWLVDGQCALAVGDIGGGLSLGRRYLERAVAVSGGRPASAAAGHALVGEAHAARGNLAEAQRELERARTLDPARRRWSVRLAVVLRRGGDHAGALAALEQLGPPAEPAIDPDWWLALGETLLAKNDAAAAVTRLAPVVDKLPGDAPIRVVLGAAQLQTGQAAIAVDTLSSAETIASSPRGKKLLSEALVTVAADKLAANATADALPLLERAEKLEATPIVLRNLGIALLATDQAGRARGVLDRAAKADGSPITLMLAARARAIGGDIGGARPLYERALAAAEKARDAGRDRNDGGDKRRPRIDGSDAVEIAIDWAASELSPGGDPTVAVAALDKVAVRARSSSLAARHKTALAKARHAAGVAALRAGQGGRAVELLRGSVAAEASLAARCDLALAAVVAGEPGPALVALRAVSGQSCPFPPPADTQAASILIAFTEGLNAKRSARALDRLVALRGKSSGPAAVLLDTSIRVVALSAANEAYRAGQLAQVKKHLAAARRANARVGTDEVAHNLAVIDLLEGRYDAAIAAFERLATKEPEALVNAGIAYERKGDHVRALDAWRRARRAGARFAPLADWIEAKERIYGGDAP